MATITGLVCLKLRIDVMGDLLPAWDLCTAPLHVAAEASVCSKDMTQVRMHHYGSLYGIQEQQAIMPSLAKLGCIRMATTHEAGIFA